MYLCIHKRTGPGDNKRNLNKFLLTCFMNSYDRIMYVRIFSLHVYVYVSAPLVTPVSFRLSFEKYLDNLSEVVWPNGSTPPPPPPPFPWAKSLSLHTLPVIVLVIEFESTPAAH